MNREEAITAGARALRADAAVALGDPSWDEIDEPLRRMYRRRAAAVIDAAAPHIAAEALREAARSLDKYGVADVSLHTRTVERSLRARADRIERGDAP